jgi:uncharacterized protein YvpB
MNRSLRAATLGVVMLLMASAVPQVTPTVAAATIPVDSWIEISSTRPASGCVIEIAMEIRSEGYAVDSTEILIALFAGEEMFSADRAITDENGIAYLAVDTGWASGEGWLDISVAESYFTGMYIGLGAGESCLDQPDYVTFSGKAPEKRVVSDPEAVANGSDGVFVSGVPFYTQQRNLSCEYASLYIATAAYGNGISEYAFDEAVGWADNPHWGYRGDINGWWGNTTDYGVYAEPLANVLPAFGFSGEVFYGGSDPSYLISKLDADIPVLVWLGLWGDQRVILESQGVPYMVTAGMHVVVAYGYDDSGIWVSDPAYGSANYYSWADFIAIWSVMDGMSLAVYAN